VIIGPAAHLPAGPFCQWPAELAYLVAAGGLLVDDVDAVVGVITAIKETRAASWSSS
jgi:hypothetical protein